MKLHLLYVGRTTEAFTNRTFIQATL
jgi:hypothetical protein